METTRLIQTAQAEIDSHLKEASRLKAIAERLMDSAEWHCGQAESWNQYLGELVTPREAIVIPLQRQPEQPVLTLLQGGLE